MLEIQILQIAKLQYWSFYYDVLKFFFENDVSLLYGDTDSMLLEFKVKPGSTLKDLLDNTILNEYIDRSNLKDPSLKHDRYKGKSGYLKSETADDIITSAILLKPKLYSIMTMNGRKMAAKGISMRNIEPIPHSKFEEILQDSTVSEVRPQTNIRKVNENMCTVTINKETINAFENKRLWTDANTSYGYGHPDFLHLSGATECKPVRFESVIEPSNNNHIVHAGVDDDEMFDNELHDEDEVLLSMAYEAYENGSVRGEFEEYVDNMVQHYEHANSETEIDDFYNVSFDDLEDSVAENFFNVSFNELEDSVPEPESVEDPTKSDPEIVDLFNESFDEMEVPEPESGDDPFNDSLDISGLYDENDASIPPDDDRCANFKRKSDADLYKCSKKPKQN